jgi:putative membrane protein
MVNLLSGADKLAVAQAIAEAEEKTSTELVLVVAPASDAYQSYMMLYGLIAGSLIGTGLWATKTVISFPVLLIIQFAAIAILAFIPWVRHACLPLVPRHVRNRRAASRAYEEYLVVSRQVSAATPIVLLYISLAEHYAHILTSRLVREKIPEESWKATIQLFAATMRETGLKDACIKAVHHTVGLLALQFPDNGETNLLDNQIIEIKT